MSYSDILSTSRFTGKRHHHPSLGHSSSCKTEIPHPRSRSPPFSPPPRTGSHILLPVSVIFTTLGASWRCNHTGFVFLWLGYFTGRIVLKVHLQFSICHTPLAFRDWRIFHGMYIPHFAYPFICWCTPGLLAHVSCCEWCSHEYGDANVFSWLYFKFIWVHIQSWMARSYINSIFIFWTTTLIFLAVTPFYIPTNKAQGFWFLHIFSNIWYFLNFKSNYSRRDELITHHSFDLYFPND